jgi:hypothetical protein
MEIPVDHFFSDHSDAATLDALTRGRSTRKPWVVIGPVDKVSAFFKGL